MDSSETVAVGTLQAELCLLKVKPEENLMEAHPHKKKHI
jgi:hypothetical protein